MTIRRKKTTPADYSNKEIREVGGRHAYDWTLIQRSINRLATDVDEFWKDPRYQAFLGEMGLVKSFEHILNFKKDPLDRET